MTLGHFKRRAKTGIVRLPAPAYRLVPRRYRPVPHEFHAVISSHARKCDGFFFIQIGANDGVRSDPLHLYILGYRWSGILVEPVPYLFERLRRNYATHGNLVFENAAIANEDCARTFYYMAETVESAEHLPRWCNGIGSFSREHIMQNQSWAPDIGRYLVSAQVTCMSLQTLIRKHRLEGVDLLCVDAEGYDYEIIRQIDAAYIRPRIILYENANMDEATKQECIKYLQDRSYSLLHCGENSLAHLCRNET